MAQNHISLEEFQQLFGSEEACIDALYASKWSNGFKCPRCAHPHAYTISTRRLPLYECINCHHQTSVIAGTIMEGSRTKLSNWFLAIYLVATEGTSASYFSKITGVTYKTSWLILTKIRYMLSQSDADTLLLGVVKVNAAYYGRPHNPSTQLHPQEHPVLIGSSMNDHGQLEYIKIKQVQPKHMRGKLVSNVGTKVFSQQHVDPWFSSLDYVTARFSPKRFHALLFTVAQANRWINDTFHGLGAKHLQAYLDEFCYRLNRDLDDTPILHHIFSLCTSTRTKNYSTLIQRPTASLQIAC